MKLLVTDLDGTLYPKFDDELNTYFKKNREAVQKWINKGNKFAVATARGVGHYPTICDKLGFKVHFIGGNGAENILDTGETILKSFPISVFYEVSQFIESHKIDASVSTINNRHWYWNTTNNYPIYNEKKPRWQHVEILKPHALPPDTKIERIAIWIDEHRLEDLKNELIPIFSDKVNITTSDKDTIDFGPLNSSKGISILELAERYDINQENIITVGDSENDIPMFKIAKRSYCIKHASDIVQRNATKIVDTFSDAVSLELEMD